MQFSRSELTAVPRLQLPLLGLPGWLQVSCSKHLPALIWWAEIFF